MHDAVEKGLRHGSPLTTDACHCRVCQPAVHTRHLNSDHGVLVSLPQTSIPPPVIRLYAVTNIITFTALVNVLVLTYVKCHDCVHTQSTYTCLCSLHVHLNTNSSHVQSLTIRHTIRFLN